MTAEGAGPLLFYYRNGCHLCEELAALLFRHWPEQAGGMEWRDVDERDDWREAYGHLVPVLKRGSETISTLRPDTARIAQYFGTNANPV